MPDCSDLRLEREEDAEWEKQKSTAGQRKQTMPRPPVGGEIDLFSAHRGGEYRTRPRKQWEWLFTFLTPPGHIPMKLVMDVHRRQRDYSWFRWGPPDLSSASTHMRNVKLKSNEQIAIECTADIHAPHRTSPSYFGFSLSFPPVPPSVQNVNFTRTISHNIE